MSQIIVLSFWVSRVCATVLLILCFKIQWVSINHKIVPKRTKISLRILNTRWFRQKKKYIEEIFESALKTFEIYYDIWIEFYILSCKILNEMKTLKNGSCYFTPVTNKIFGSTKAAKIVLSCWLQELVHSLSFEWYGSDNAASAEQQPHTSKRHFLNQYV